METKKPCTRSLTCKTHSLTQRRAVQGRRKRFDVLLAEHKNKSREKEVLRHPDQQPPQPQQIPPLREPHASPSRTSAELHQNSHGAIPAEFKPLVSNKPRPHNPSLPRSVTSSPFVEHCSSDSQVLWSGVLRDVGLTVGVEFLPVLDVGIPGLHL